MALNKNLGALWLIALMGVVGCSGGGSSSGGEGSSGGSGPMTPTEPDPQTPLQQCVGAITSGLNSCTAAVRGAVRTCFVAGGSTCTNVSLSADASMAISMLTNNVSTSCDASLLTEAGYTIGVTELNAQLTEQCVGLNTTLATRTFGGPRGAVLQSADVQNNAADPACLETAYTESSSFAEQTVNAYQQCLEAGGCGSILSDVATLANAAEAAIAAACTNGDRLEALVGTTPAELLDRTRVDAECQVANTNPGATGISLECAPIREVRAIQAYEYSTGSAVEVFPGTETRDTTPSTIIPHTIERGEYVQIEMDPATTGAMCGDGSPYRFWIQPAPEGQPLDNLVVFLEGGGACTGAACTNNILTAIDVANGGGGSSRLNNFLSDNVGENSGRSGFTSVTLATNPYRNWSKVYLNYCTQDVYAGGEGGEQIITVNVPGAGSVDYPVQRTGGHNVREAMKYTRNVLWGLMNEEGIAYDPAAFKVAFTGSSAGGWGSRINYHVAADEMRWTNAALVNLWGLAVDDEGVFGAGLRALFSTLTPLWNSDSTYAPYCQVPECVHAEDQALRILEQMDTSRFPRQHYSLATAQVDQTQSNSTGFGNSQTALERWGNALRATYCRMRDPALFPSQDNLHFFLPLVQRHNLGAVAVYAPDNITYVQWQANFEAALAVDDSVDNSGNVINPGASNELTLDPFPCTF